MHFQLDEILRRVERKQRGWQSQRVSDEHRERRGVISRTAMVKRSEEGHVKDKRANRVSFLC